MVKTMTRNSLTCRKRVGKKIQNPLNPCYNLTIEDVLVRQRGEPHTQKSTLKTTLKLLKFKELFPIPIGSLGNAQYAPLREINRIPSTWTCRETCRGFFRQIQHKQSYHHEKTSIQHEFQKVGGPQMHPKVHRVEVKNWEKWNPGEKTSGWFKFSANFFEDCAVQRLNSNEKILFTWLLCRCAQFKRSSVEFTGSSLAVHVRFRGSSLTVGLRKLAELQLIEIQKERKKEREERPSKLAKNKRPILPKNYTKEFNELWESWPSNGAKGSKSTSFKNLNKWAEQHSLEKAYEYAQNYIAFATQEKTEMPYYLSNFFGEKAYWEDFTKPKKAAAQKNNANKDHGWGVKKITPYGEL